MVSEKYDESYYKHQIKWVDEGITQHAIIACNERWTYENYLYRTMDLDVIRNKGRINKPIKLLKKW